MMMTALALAAALGVTATLAASAKATTELTPQEWMVLGAFPNEALATPTAEGVTRKGFDYDFLTSLGGEPKAAFAKTTKMASGEKVLVVKSRPVEMVNLKALYTETDNKIAYAYGVIRSDKNQRLKVLFGSDDAAKVWLNGELVHRIWTPGRAADMMSDTFEIDVKKGDNPVLVKVDNGAGDWGFYFRVLDEDGINQLQAVEARKNLPLQEIGAVGQQGFLFSSEQLPQLEWRNAYLLKPLVESKLKVRWFDGEANEVKTATKPGTYFAYVEAKTTDGLLVRNLVPFARVNPGWMDFAFSLYNPESKFVVGDNMPDGMPIDPANWPKVKGLLSGTVGMTLGTFISSNLGAALVVPMLEEGKEYPKGYEAQLTQLDKMLAIKRKILGVTGSPLKMPSRLTVPAPEIRLGTAQEAGIKPEAVAQLDALCAEWAKEEGRPFSVVMARNGVVFLHSAYGELGGRKLDKDATFYPASIGKAIAGLMFAQFVDQGLIGIDDPVGKYLVDFPTTGKRAITFRNCFTHTSAYVGHRTFDGLWNPFMDNHFSLSLPYIEPGKVYRYGGDGNNLAGKAMELVAGKPMVRLLQDNLFAPLGATSIMEPDLGYSESATAMDIAKVGQLLLNKGSYGYYRFFSEETYKKILPVKLADFLKGYPDKSTEWGIGLSYMPDPDGPREKGALGPNVIGHGSASSSILRVDPDSGLVIVMGRYGVGDGAKHQEYRAKVMALVKASLIGK